MNRRDQLKQNLSAMTAARDHVAERFLAEMEFVEDLIAFESDAPKQNRRPAAGFSAKKWNELAEQAWQLVEKAVAGGSARSIEKAVTEAETLLEPIARLAKTFTVHCVGHAHIDMNWMWSWPETVNTTNDTFLTMLKLMDEYPDFCFTQSQASVYEIVERHNPPMLDAIRARVKEGRWEVVASHWVEGEKNIVSGESLARHLLYTRKYMKELFGLEAADIPVEWTPDTFGHAITVPACEARGGVRRIYMCRGGQGWAKPPVFWYQSPDGSRVLVNYETTWYNDRIGPHNAKAMLQFCTKTGLRDWMNVYGVGDHGGGPTRRDIERCHDMNTWPVYPNFKLATSGPFFDLLEQHGDKWPVIDRELNFEFPGCYTTQTVIKRNNRFGETYGVEAEWAGVLGMIAGGVAYPEAPLEQVWRTVCFNHFHDILPGSGVHATQTYNDGQFQEIAATTSLIKMNALRAVAARVDTFCGVAATLPPVQPEQVSVAMGAGPGHRTMVGGISAAGHVADGPRPYVVFNPTAHKRTEVVTATVWDPQTGLYGDDLNAKNYIIRTADGREIPAQKLNQGDWYWSNKFIDLAFPIEVGSLGYAACVAVDAGTKFTQPWGAWGYERFAADKPVEGGVKMLTQTTGGGALGQPLPVGGYGMENEHLLVELDAMTGGICRLVDKASGKDLANPADPMGVLEFAHERHGGMTAWIIYDAYKKSSPDIPTLTRKHAGPWVCSIEAKTKVASSEVAVTYTLKAGQPWVEIAVQTRWVEIGSPAVGTPKLSMKFPLALTGAKATYEIPFGAIQRDQHAGEEVPALRWADVNGKQPGGAAGCALLNDSKHGHSLTGDTLRLTLIRSAYDPDPIPEVGDHSIHMALAPHGAGLSTADRTRMAAAFTQPLQVIITDVHKGTLPAKLTALECSADNVLVSSVKKAQGADAIIVRLYETEGKPASAKLSLSPELFGAVVEAAEVDFLERPTDTNTAKATKEGFTVKLSPHAIVSVKVVLKK
ncbi:MAG: glycosyl hydrolase-related protein [Phycisphaerae bacterium]|nr:glycosyl hydrolase-related protein [Phycisphaerae bacterium]